jgi:fructosamine-3-kinase
MSLADRAARLLGGRAATVTPLAGGELSSVIQLELVDGRMAIVKGGPDPVAEAKMLEAIGRAGAPAPAVLAVDTQVLVLEVLPSSGGLESAWRDLGLVLARLHGARGPRFGWCDDYAFGEVAIVNGWTDDWPRFWSERRLVNHLTALPPDLARRVERLAAALPDRLPATPPASLLHGDLWSGNVLAAGPRVTGLVDPACYYGDAEVDFAMLRLFAAPGFELLEAYGALAPGSEKRLPIYQLWPALVHLRLFGQGYRPMVEGLLTDCGV